VALALAMVSCLGVADDSSIVMTIIEGSKMNGLDAARLERSLSADDGDYESRARLLGYYLGNMDGNETERKQLVLWVIENRPASYLASMPYAQIYYGQVGYEEAKKLWLAKVKSQPKDAAILKNAANYLSASGSSERDLARELLNRGKELSPDDSYWDETLGRGYLLQAEYELTEEEEKRQAASTALKHLQLAMAEMARPNRFYQLSGIAKAALLAAENKYAKKYAMELLSMAPEFEKNWNYGNAIHDGNLILGRLAFDSGEIEVAKGYLAEAGKTPGSPQLNSFGPSFELAESLLEKGEKKAVIGYLKACAVFWKDDSDRIEQWIILIENGKKPALDKHS